MKVEAYSKSNALNNSVYAEITDVDDIQEVKDLIKSEFEKSFSVKKTRLTLKATHSMLRKCKRAFEQDVKAGSYASVKFTDKCKTTILDIEYSDEIPFIIGAANEMTIADIRAEVIQFWKSRIGNISGLLLINAELVEWMDTSVISNSTPSGKKGPVHTPEWNQHISEARKGMRLKTKGREGVEWHWEGNKKVWN